MILTEKRFARTTGIFIEFEYIMEGGITYNGITGDGFTVFFYDGDVGYNDVNAGAFGRALGYCYMRSYNMSLAADGVKGGYLGIGFDNFGNNKLQCFSEERVNGIVMSTNGITGYNSTYNGRSNITLRGAMGKGIPGIVGMERDQRNGYPVLITRSTDESKANAAAKGPIVLDPNNGTYKLDTSLAGVKNTDFGLSTQGGQYRKAFIEMYPINNNPNYGYWITVKIQHSNTLTTVIYDYPYISTVSYHENSIPVSGSDYHTNGGSGSRSQRIDLDATIPNICGLALLHPLVQLQMYIKSKTLKLPCRVQLLQMMIMEVIYM